jgi:uncharacterized delta-60 repeat protein
MSAGSLDTTFNSPNGVIFKQYTSGYETWGKSVAIDSSGRIVVTGDTSDTTDTKSMFITRYLANGTVDTSFANGGVVIKQFNAGKDTIVWSLAIDSKGRIVVTGGTFDNTDTVSMFITRYLADGSLDTSFANGGVIIKQYTTGKSTEGQSVAIDSNDRIVVTGYTIVIIGTSMFITRYLANGNVDASFADGGVVFEQYTSRYETVGFSVAIDSNDRVVVTGSTRDETDTRSMFITRYLANGNVDTSFANGGVVVKRYTTAKTNVGISVAIDSSDRVVVTGATGDDIQDNFQNLSMFITRYLANGSLDTGFADGGVIIKKYDVETTVGQSVAIDSNDRVVITGVTSDNTYIASMFITRYLDNGSLDTSFAGGVVLKIYISEQDTRGSSVAIDSSDRVVVTGETSVNTNIESMFITRYLGDNVTTSTTTEPICLVAGTPILTDQGIVAIEKIDTTKHTINNKRIVAVTKAISPEKHLVCFEANSMGINCPSQRTIMTPGHEVLYKGKLVQSKHFVGRVTGVHTMPYNGKDVLYNVLQEHHGLMRVNGMLLETLHPENKVAKELLKK